MGDAMQMHSKTLVVILCEAALEAALIADSERLGAHGYTIVDARGGGRRGVRSAAWDADRSIRMEIICDAITARNIVTHVHKEYFANYAMTVYTAEVGVLRAEKF